MIDLAMKYIDGLLIGTKLIKRKMNKLTAFVAQKNVMF